MRIFFGLFLLCTVSLYPSEQIQFISCNVTFKSNLEKFVLTLSRNPDTAHCINEYGMNFAQALRALIELDGRSPQFVDLAHQHNVSLEAQQQLSPPCMPCIEPIHSLVSHARPESPSPQAIALRTQSAPTVPTTFPIACQSCKEVTITIHPTAQQPLVAQAARLQPVSVAERLGFKRIFSCCQKAKVKELPS